MRHLVLAALLIAAPALAQPPAATPPPADAQPAPVPQAVTVLANPPMTGPRLLIQTAMGDITLQLDDQRAPASVASILGFVKKKHYDGTVVYRVAKGFVIQLGSFEAHNKGRGFFPKPVPLEAGNGLHNFRGTVALAHGDAPDSGNAEFFVNLGDNSQIDQKPGDPNSGFAVFGQVASGMDVVDAIGQVPTGDDGPMKGQAPVDPILVKKISVLK
jgi:peptidyl-prolyl cis-trans isomerase A (cyclophilin A)